METPPIPDIEEERLESLRKLNILDTPGEERFDRITRLAARSFGVKYSEINLIDEDRQWSKSQFGLHDPESPREYSFCTRTMLNNDVTVITDASEHEQFSDNPYVTDDPNIRFYMSYRLKTPEGYPAGTLCVFDDEPHDPDSDDVEMFQDFARMAESELEKTHLSREQERLLKDLEDAERRASTDSLTRCWNKEMIREILDRELERSNREGLPLCVSMLDIDHFKDVNDRYGHQAGDEVLAEVAGRIRKALRPYDALGRYGGEEFMIIFVKSDLDTGREIGERVRAEIASPPVKTPEWDIDVTASLGVTEKTGEEDSRDLIEEADQNLYKAKEEGRNRVIVG